MSKNLKEITIALSLAILIVGVLLANAYCNKYYEKEEMYNKNFNSQVLPKMGQE